MTHQLDDRWAASTARGTPEFQALPFMCRVTYAVLLELCDEQGCIELNGDEPSEAIAKLVGSPQMERQAVFRSMRRNLPALLEQGFIRRSDRGCLHILDFEAKGAWSPPVGR